MKRYAMIVDGKIAEMALSATVFPEGSTVVECPSVDEDPTGDYEEGAGYDVETSTLTPLDCSPPDAAAALARGDVENPAAMMPAGSPPPAV
jgi:hypothetical protein